MAETKRNHHVVRAAGARLVEVGSVAKGREAVRPEVANNAAKVEMD
jgi:hypothetical protein